MRQVFVISVIFCLSICAFALTTNDATSSNLITFDKLPLNKRHVEKVLEGNYIVNSVVKTIAQNTKQKFDYNITGYHKRSCSFAVKKLRQYENFKDYVGIVKESTYNDKTRELFFKVDPPILNTKLILNFKIDRIGKKGVYPFTFDKGFLKGLHGKIHISEYKRRCLFFVESNWEGPKTQFPDQIMATFALVASKMAMDRLFKVSSVY